MRLGYQKWNEGLPWYAISSTKLSLPDQKISQFPIRQPFTWFSVRVTGGASAKIGI